MSWTAVQRRQSLRILWSGQFLAIAGLTVLVPLLPFYLRELGATAGENSFWTGMALAAPAVTLCLTSPLWGRVGDRHGRKWMVARALFGLALSLFLMAMVQSPLALFLCRLLQGACGGVVDAASAYAASEAPEEERGQVLGKLQGATAAGSLFGPLIGGLLADVIGFRQLLLLMAVLTAASGVLTSVALRESKPKRVAKSEQGRVHHSFTRVFVEMLQHRRLRAFLIAGLLAQTGIYGLVTAFAPHVELLLGSSDRAASWVGILQALTWGAGLLGAAWWGKRNDRHSIENNMFWALALCGLSIALQALPQEASGLIPLRLLQGFAFAALLQSVFLAVAQETGRQSRGERIGAANSFLVLGQIIGPLLGGVLGGIWTTGAVFVAMGALFIVGALCMMCARIHIRPLGSDRSTAL
ncbi:hypothetical protein CIG75_02860 [Tumebacillus algifaecis]|uniref:Major facilitator superfamily (MFS) profile domain-containing protein n=1 Tax=Tumebacillus algifaecis TaxID=1214604 RepID=A0A223CXZ8_9BACL|nr:MFS transporter [Tumebacillus algifaecis]ASS74024.1 hypothetical protein CIG75_02860 [Tumebacillus algifaecis]